jgi:hypothetical protein
MATTATAVQGYQVLRGVVAEPARERALRHIHLDLVRNGATAETIGRWLWSAHWFPHLKWDAEIVQLLDEVPRELVEGELCDPQILLQPPDTGEGGELTPHLDAEPDWAGGRPYLRIVGVALSPNRRANGGLVVWPFGGGAPTPLELEPGDAVVMDPRLPHTSGFNLEGAIRYAVYFRFLAPS